LSTAPSISSSELRVRPTRGPIARWAPVVVWATCISWFSTGAFSAQSTNSYIDPVLRYFFGELSPETFRFAHTIIRKSAHFLEYAVLAILLCRALTEPGVRPSPALLLKVILWCAVYACLDELHQLFVPKRTGSLYDSMLDTTGATVGALLLWMWRSGSPSTTGTGLPAREISAPSRGSASAPSDASARR
jgi:VanZ family protein